MIWTFLPSNVAGRTKKTVVATVLFVAYCVGNAVGAQMFVASDAPRYIKGLTACAVLYCVEFLSMATWRFYCRLPLMLNSLVLTRKMSGRIKWRRKKKWMNPYLKEPIVHKIFTQRLPIWMRTWKGKNDTKHQHKHQNQQKTRLKPCFRR